MNIIVLLGVIGGGALLGLVVFEILYHFLANPEDKLEYAKQKAEKKSERDAKRAERAKKKEARSIHKSRNKNALELRTQIALVVNRIVTKGSNLSYSQESFLKRVFINKNSSGGWSISPEILPRELRYKAETEEEKCSREKINQERMLEYNRSTVWSMSHRDYDELTLNPPHSEEYHLVDKYLRAKYVSDEDLDNVSYLASLQIECYMPSFVSMLVLYLNEPTEEIANKIGQTLIEVSLDTLLPILAIKKEEIEIDKTVKKQFITNITTELEEDMEIYRKNKIKIK